MATLNVIYKISADISGLQKGVDQTAQSTERMATQMEGLQGSAMRAGAALLGAFSATAVISAVVSLGKELVADASALEFLADKTGLGVEAIQRFRSVTDEAGGSVEGLAAGLNRLQKGIIEDSAAAVQGMNRLGLSIGDFEKLDPEQQIIALGKALEGVHDPAERVAIATELMGRAGAENLPALLHMSKDLGEGVDVMSKQSVDALDEMGDATARLWRSFKANIGDSIGEAIIRQKQNWSDLQLLFSKGVNIPPIPDITKPFREAVPAALGGFSSIAAAEKALTDQVRTSITAHEKATKAIADQTAEQEKWAAQSAGLERHVRDQVMLMHDLKDAFGTTDIEVRNLTSTTLPQYQIALDQVGQSAQVTISHTESLAKTLADFFTNIPKGLGAIQEDLSKTLAHLFGASPDSVFTSIISGGLNFVFGPVGGLLVSIIQQGMTAALGIVWDGLKKIGSALKSFFSPGSRFENDPNGPFAAAAALGLTPGMTSGTGIDSGEPSYGSLGGLVTNRGIQYLASGTSSLFKPVGMDTVPAMLSPGEMVLSREKANQHLNRSNNVVDFSEMKRLREEFGSLKATLVEQGMRQPERIALAVRDAVVQANARRR